MTNQLCLAPGQRWSFSKIAGEKNASTFWRGRELLYENCSIPVVDWLLQGPTQSAFQWPMTVGYVGCYSQFQGLGLQIQQFWAKKVGSQAAPVEGFQTVAPSSRYKAPRCLWLSTSVYWNSSLILIHHPSSIILCVNAKDQWKLGPSSGLLAMGSHPGAWHVFLCFEPRNAHIGTPWNTETSENSWICWKDTWKDLCLIIPKWCLFLKNTNKNQTEDNDIQWHCRFLVQPTELQFCRLEPPDSACGLWLRSLRDFQMRWSRAQARCDCHHPGVQSKLKTILVVFFLFWIFWLALIWQKTLKKQWSLLGFPRNLPTSSNHMDFSDGCLGKKAGRTSS